MTNSRVLRKLRAGETAKCTSMSRVTEPWLAEVIGRSGFDVIWFDLEHRSHNYHMIDPISLACRATGIDLMVRIRKSGYDSVMRALEFGANGIMVPHCRSAEEARQWVEWAKFPPAGKRGLDGAGADADWGFAPLLDHIRHANEQTFVVLQIEDREAVEQIEEIAAVPGFDVLFVGPGDLSLSYGVPGETQHPLLEAAIDRIAAACGRHGKWWGTVTGHPARAQNILDRGGRFLAVPGDHGWLVRGLAETWASFGPIQPS